MAKSPGSPHTEPSVAQATKAAPPSAPTPVQVPTQGQAPAPYQGRALDPARRADVVAAPGAETQIQPQRPGAPPTEGLVQPTVHTAPDPSLPSPENFHESPPPEQPQTAAEVAEWQQRYGELSTAMNTQRAEFTRQMKEMEIRMELANQTQQAPTPLPQIQLPPGMDPNQQITAGEFAQVLSHVIPTMEGNTAAATLRGSSRWTVSAEEEQAILASSYGQQLPAHEPARSQYILRISQIRNGDSTSQAPGVQGQAQQAPGQPITQRVVSATETSQGAETNLDTSASPRDPVREAYAAYMEAKNRPTSGPQEADRRKVDMRRAFDAYEKARGLSDGPDARSRGFKVSS